MKYCIRLLPLDLNQKVLLFQMLHGPAHLALSGKKKQQQQQKHDLSSFCRLVAVLRNSQVMPALALGSEMGPHKGREKLCGI